MSKSKRIEEVVKKGEKELNLSGLKLNKFPSELKKPLLGKKSTQSLAIKTLDVSINQLNDLKWDLSNDFATLERLHMSGNPISSILVIGIPGSPWLNTLTHLELMGCKITRVGPVDLRTLPNLRHLNLSNNSISELHEDAFISLKNLEELSIGGNGGLTSLPAAITKLSKLNLLDVSGCGLKSLPDEIGDMMGLLEFNVGNNRVAEIPSSIGRLTRLCLLNIQDNLLVNLPYQIGNCRGLTKSSGGLILHGNPLCEELASLYAQSNDKLYSYLERRLALNPSPLGSSGSSPLPISNDLISKLSPSLASSVNSNSSSPSNTPLSSSTSGINQSNSLTNTQNNTSTGNLQTRLLNMSGSSSVSSSPAGSYSSSPMFYNGTGGSSGNLQYKLSASNELRELPDHIPGPRSSSPNNFIPIPNSNGQQSRSHSPFQHNNSPSSYSSSPTYNGNNVNSNNGSYSSSPYSSSPSQIPPPTASSNQQSLQTMLGSLNISSEISILRERIFMVIRNDIRTKITYLYEKVNRAAVVEDLIQHATLIKSTQDELDQLSKILAYKKHVFPSVVQQQQSSSSPGNSTPTMDKFNQLKQLVKSKIEMCVVYSKSTIEHVEICSNPTELQSILNAFTQINTKLNV